METQQHKHKIKVDIKLEKGENCVEKGGDKNLLNYNCIFCNKNY